MKAASALRPRERQLALVALVLIGCWVVISWVVQPLWDRFVDLRLRVQTQAERLEAIGRLLNEGSAIERRHLELTPYFSSQEDGVLQAVLLDQLEALSKRTQVQLNLKPRPVRRAERVNRFEVELELQGPQAAVLQFLDQLMAMEQLIEVERFRLAHAPVKEPLLRANVVIRRLVLPFQGKSPTGT